MQRLQPDQDSDEIRTLKAACKKVTLWTGQAADVIYVAWQGKLCLGIATYAEARTVASALGTSFLSRTRLGFTPVYVP